MRETERPINFKPWLYEIARNASIDAFRRKRRTSEVSYDAEGGLAPNDRLRLVASEPGPVEAIGAKEEIEHLTGAFGGLSETHHEILVLRELEGRSYADIGERLGMSRGAVESTLFRARKRLGEEYEELASGRRCERVQTVITEGEVPHLGARDQRKMARHLAHCQSCRRLAALTGVEIPAALPKRAADKLRSLLPVPAWIARGGGDGGVVVQLYAGSGEPLINAWSRAIAALVALAVAGAGVGVQPPGRTQKDAALASASPEHSARQAPVALPARGGAAHAHGGSQQAGERVARGARRTAGRRRQRRRRGRRGPRGDAGCRTARSRRWRRPWRPRPCWPRRPRSRSPVSRTPRPATRSRAAAAPQALRRGRWSRRRRTARRLRSGPWSRASPRAPAQPSTTRSPRWAAWSPARPTALTDPLGPVGGTVSGVVSGAGPVLADPRGPVGGAVAGATEAVTGAAGSGRRRRVRARSLTRSVRSVAWWPA